MKRIMRCVFLKSVFLLLPAVVFFQSSKAGGTATDDAQEIINDIITTVGLKANFEVRAATIANAAATNYRGKRFIVYDPAFIKKLNEAAGNRWASVSILAHEIGHHLNGHTLANNGSQPALELEADEFAGFVMEKMGATLQQAQAAMKLAASYKPSLTHPGQQDRLAAIQKGWERAGTAVTDLAKYSKPVLPERSEATAAAPANAENMMDSRYILATVDFPSDRSANYYVTKQFNVVKVQNGKLYLVGKMHKTNSTSYPFIMTGDRRNTLYVDRYGKIVTANKELAGYLKI
jgi:hypothetical protein